MGKLGRTPAQSIRAPAARATPSTVTSRTMTKTDWFKQQLKLIADDVRELGCSELNYTILGFAPSTALTSLVTARQD